MSDNSKSAFPMVYWDRDSTGACVPRESEFGMSLRDWFAGQASERDIAVHQYYYFEGKDRRRSREQAKYVYADKMMQARRDKG